MEGARRSSRRGSTPSGGENSTRPRRHLKRPAGDHHDVVHEDESRGLMTDARPADVIGEVGPPGFPYVLRGGPLVRRRGGGPLILKEGLSRIVTHHQQGIAEGATGQQPLWGGWASCAPPLIPGSRQQGA